MRNKSNTTDHQTNRSVLLDRDFNLSDIVGAAGAGAVEISVEYIIATGLNLNDADCIEIAQRIRMARLVPAASVIVRGGIRLAERHAIQRKIGNAKGSVESHSLGRVQMRKSVD